MKKFIGLCAVLGLLFACTGTASPSSKDDGDKDAKAFSVALASKVKLATIGILAPDAAAVTNKVEGLAVATSSAMQAENKAIEVWLTDATYVKDNGDVKEKTTGKSYVVYWDAYDPAGTATTSIKNATPADNKVGIEASETGKASRMKITVGTDFLDKSGGAVVVVSIYEPDTTELGLDKATGRVEQYKLTITKATPLDLTGTSASANGFAKATAPTQTEMNGAPIAAKAVTVFGSDPDMGVVELALTTAASVGTTLVGYNNFAVSGGKLPTMTWVLKGTAAPSSGGSKIATTNLAASGNSAGANTAFGPLPLTPTVRADFVAANGTKGAVSLVGTGDKYGRTATILISLDDGM